MNYHDPAPDYPGANHHHQQPHHHQGNRHPVGPARSTLSHSSHVSGPPGSVRSGPLPPGNHTMVTMNTAPTPGASVTEINLNIGYYKTLPGILKLIQLVRDALMMSSQSLLLIPCSPAESTAKLFYTYFLDPLLNFVIRIQLNTS